VDRNYNQIPRALFSEIVMATAYVDDLKPISSQRGEHIFTGNTR